VDLGSKDVREEIEMVDVPVAAATTVPACGLCGALLAPTLVTQHHAYHQEQSKKKK
jgi:hypothetical protein